MDDLDWRLEYVRSVYAETLEETRRLRDRVGHVTGVFIIPLSSAIYFLYSKREDDLVSLLSVLFFLAPLAIAVLLLISAIAVLFVVLKGSYEYERPPRPSRLSEYFKKNPSLRVLKEGLISEYDAAIDHNCDVNMKRSNRLMLVQKLAVWALPALMVASFYSFSISFNRPEKPQKVEVIFDEHEG